MALGTPQWDLCAAFRMRTSPVRISIAAAAHARAACTCASDIQLLAGELNCAVVMVGRKGVGDAVDSFNLNATYMEGNGARVIGAVFNRCALRKHTRGCDPEPERALCTHSLPLEGFYSLDSCKNVRAAPARVAVPR